jgi:hypothetical protein
MPYVLLGFIGCWKCWRWGSATQRNMVILVATLILYNWLMAILVWPLVRYMVPVMWLLMLMIPAVVLCRRPGTAKLAESPVVTPA